LPWQQSKDRIIRAEIEIRFQAKIGSSGQKSKSEDRIIGAEIEIRLMLTGTVTVMMVGSSGQKSKSASDVDRNSDSHDGFLTDTCLVPNQQTAMRSKLSARSELDGCNIIRV
jgi:hypothetical protein